MIEMTQQKPHISKRCCRICFPIYMPALNLPVLSRRLLALRIKPESAANPCYSITSFLRTFVMSWGSAATRLVHTPLRCHDRYCLQDLQHHVSDHRTVLVFYFIWLLVEGFERFDRWFNCCFFERYHGWSLERSSKHLQLLWPGQWFGLGEKSAS
jgi:hypothetical protein